MYIGIVQQDSAFFSSNSSVSLQASENKFVLDQLHTSIVKNTSILSPHKEHPSSHKEPPSTHKDHPSLFQIQLECGQKVRNYQYELAEPGIQGKNYILVAPTGSGKTLVATLVIADHLSKRKTDSNCHVGFIVPTKPLADQQTEKLKALISGVKVSIFTGDTHISMAESIKESHISVCTAGKLYEEIYYKRVAISQFSLLVFDECHHTVKDHPYAQLMKLYLEEKIEASCSSIAKRTQIIGMTASPGSGQNRYPAILKTFDHLKKLIAHLDATSGIKIVVKYREELKACIKMASVEYREVEPRETINDPFVAEILSVMNEIEEELFEKLKYSKHTKWSQEYQTKLKQIIFIAELSTDERCRDQISASNQLFCYSIALSIYMDLSTADAIKVINDLKAEFPAMDKATPVENRLRNKNQKLLSKITPLPPMENPLLDEIGAVLLKKFSANRSSRAIVFVRTRDHTVAMKEWIGSHSSLKDVGICPGSITGYTSRDDMTRAKQEGVLKQFHEGKINVLVTTSVAEEGLDIPECNLVIRYQNVSNEIAKAQAEGRARAEDSNCYTITSSSSTKKYQELRNEELLNQVQAIIESDILSSGYTLETEILHLQQGLVQEKKKKDLQQKMRKSNPASSVELLCKKCKTFACMGSDVCTLTEEGPHHYLVPMSEFREKFRVKCHHKPCAMIETFFKTHKIHCVVCDNDWGVQVVSSTNGEQYPIIKCCNFIFKIRYRSIKKWCDVPFVVEPLNS